MLDLANADIDAMIADPETYTDRDRYHALFSHLRANDPVRHVAPAGIKSFWLVSRYEDMIAVESKGELFLNAPRAVMKPIAVEQELAAKQGGHSETLRSMNNMDGAEHRAVRSITSRQFLMPSVAKLTADIDAIAAEYVARLVQNAPETDFVRDVAAWYPLRVIMVTLGVPASDEAQMLELTQKMFEVKPGQAQGAAGSDKAKAAAAFFEYFEPHLEARRANPTGDIASLVANAQVNGAPLGRFESLSYCLTLATAGHDTTSATLSGGLLALMENPDQMALLRADPALLPQAVEEMLRWVAPVKHFFRTAAEDTEIAGVAIAKGDNIMLPFPSGGFDADVVQDPFRFDITRKPNPHLALGAGPHACLGQHLARLEIQRFFMHLLDRLEDFELAGTPVYQRSTFISGLSSLPLRYKVKS